MTSAYLCLVLGYLLISHGAQGATTNSCFVAPEHDAITFPVERLTTEARCMLAAVIDHASTSGVIGPNQTPIGFELYGYLLDHPAMTATLLERLGIGSATIVDEGEGRYRVDDGEGAEGLLRILAQDRHHRIYYIDGEHRSTLFPTVKAKTAVFLRLSLETESRRPTVETRLISYTRFEDGMLARVLRLFKPLVTHALIGALRKEFSMTHRLGVLIVEQPQRVLEIAEALTYATPDDRRTFLDLLRAEMFLSQPAGPHS